ncbi:hypothetical protein GCM10010978_32080 [Compostibacillus humi]|uniref:BA3454 family stress response protein n=1 Tax=Compostibacillus humi TaxID=1245525 RepID=A0A8J2TUA8_9BACI|nr:BA3454 family stress response protein [Compostibacillus humi]GFZ90774.1 hypothetical protein GCM10010978_32080 [Compostibacillus humi]HLT55219.1 BA3454 family stress response protein [Bacillota bacterium]
MIQVNVTVDYEGQTYHTNVIAAKDTKEEEILQMALHQVEKQLEQFQE